MNRILVILIAAASLVGAGLWLHEQSRPAVQASRPLDLAALDRSIHAPGIVEGAAREVSLRLEVSGRVARVFVKEGDFVEAGQTLVKLDDATQRHNIAILAAEVEYAQAQLQRLKNGAHQQERAEAKALLDARRAKLNHAELEWDRTRRLLAQKAVGEQEVAHWEAQVNAFTAEALAAQARVDLLESPPRHDELQAAEARVEVARARLELAKTDLAKTELTAPSAGQVLELLREPGELIDLSDPRPVIVIADTRRKRVRAYVEELDALHVRPGMAARITADGLPGCVFAGEVVEVMPRMSFKQVWTDRPDERFDAKTREVLIEIRGVESAGNGGAASLRQTVTTSARPTELVYGLLVEVEMLPTTTTPKQALSLNR